jgi:hypothetical protein
MEKPVPIGTHGLYLDPGHPAFNYFSCAEYTTPQWYDIVEGSRAFILDGMDIDPIIWTIDNFKRCHKLGNLFELRVGCGKVIVCTTDLRGKKDSLPAKWLEYSIRQYMTTPGFMPQAEVTPNEFAAIFQAR